MKKQRTILITNDDGIEAPGILLLAELAREFGEAVVVAPSSQCSAMSQRLTLKQEMEIRAREDFPVEGVKAWSLDGTPADCVKIALRILSVKPDLVFSGINEGFNTGFDIAYSGTCGACFEALFNGIPAIAFSNENCRNYSAVRAHMAELTEELLQKEIERNAFWNINFPACDAGELKGIEYDRRPAEMQLYADNIPQKHYPDGRRTVMEWGVPVRPDEAPEGTDIHAVLHGKISVGKVFTGLMSSGS